MTAKGYDYIIVGAGSAGCVRRKPAVRRSILPRTVAGGRRLRPKFLAQAAGRLLPDDLQRAFLAPVQDRAVRRHRRSLDRLAARPRAGRLVIHQWPDLHSRPARGLRRLGTSRRDGMELPRTAAVLPALRTLFAAAKASIMAASASSRFPTCATTMPHPRPGSRPASSLACRAIPISTVKRRSASAAISSASAGIGAPVRHRPS